MSRKGLSWIIVGVMLFYSFSPSFYFAEAKNTIEACLGPTATMTEYFNFQNEAIRVLVGSKINERLLKISHDSGWIFTDEMLQLSSMDNLSPIDLLALNVVGEIESSVSNSLTSVVLLAFISFSVVRSNFEGLAILFEDRPIVRDYKQMLDIDTQLFDVAYSLSKKINLVRPMEGDMGANMKDLVTKYQENGLLSEDISIYEKNSVSAVIIELLKMNTAMEGFIAFGDEIAKDDLLNYLAKDAIKQLDEDYEEVRNFSVCNSYFDFITEGIGGINNNSLKKAKKDVSDAAKRLSSALFGKGSWNFKNGRNDMCEGLSDYEMAQLKAYWGSSWTCGKFVNASADLEDVSSARLKVKKYFKEKKEKNENKKNPRKSQRGKGKNGTAASDVISQTLSSEKKVRWNQIFSGNYQYNPEFSSELNANFEGTYKDVMVLYQQSQENAISSDVSDLLPMIKGVLDQTDSATKNMEKFRETLQKTKNKQCQ